MATRRTIRVEPSWHQGKGGFGGLLAAKALAAMTEDVDDLERVPRSLTMHFCAPATGELELTTEIVRVGRLVTHATARFEGERGVTTFGSSSFAKDRPGAERYVHAEMPEVQGPALASELPATTPGVPAFFEHVEARFCGSARPCSGTPSKDARVRAWVRLREPAPVDAPTAAILLDALPPAITTTFSELRPVASVDFTIHFFVRFPLADLAAGEHCLVAITTRWADDGYAEELRDLWSPRGALLAQCRQLIALV